MNILPIFDRVLIKPREIESTTESGLVLATTTKARPEIGEVVAVGDGENFDGNKVEMKVKVGDIVLFNKYAGADVKIDNVDHIILRQIDIIGVVINE